MGIDIAVSQSLRRGGTEYVMDFALDAWRYLQSNARTIADAAHINPQDIIMGAWYFQNGLTTRRACRV